MTGIASIVGNAECGWRDSWRWQWNAIDIHDNVITLFKLKWAIPPIYYVWLITWGRRQGTIVLHNFILERLPEAPKRTLLFSCRFGVKLRNWISLESSSRQQMREMRDHQQMKYCAQFTFIHTRTATIQRRAYWKASEVSITFWFLKLGMHNIECPNRSTYTLWPQILDSFIYIYQVVGRSWIIVMQQSYSYIILFAMNCPTCDVFECFVVIRSFQLVPKSRTRYSPEFLLI